MFFVSGSSRILGRAEWQAVVLQPCTSLTPACVTHIPFSSASCLLDPLLSRFTLSFGINSFVNERSALLFLQHAEPPCDLSREQVPG